LSGSTSKNEEADGLVKRGITVNTVTVQYHFDIVNMIHRINAFIGKFGTHDMGSLSIESQKCEAYY